MCYYFCGNRAFFIGSKKLPTTVLNLSAYAVSALEKIYDCYGLQVLDRAIRLIVMTWEGEPTSLSSKMLRGVATLADIYGDGLNDNFFIERVGKLSAKEITRNAKDRHSGSIGISEALVMAYNKNTRVNKLDINQLY